MGLIYAQSLLCLSLDYCICRDLNHKQPIVDLFLELKDMMAYEDADSLNYLLLFSQRWRL